LSKRSVCGAGRVKSSVIETLVFIPESSLNEFALQKSSCCRVVGSLYCTLEVD